MLMLKFFKTKIVIILKTIYIYLDIYLILSL